LFSANDQVPLGYFAAVSGLFTIEIDAAEGLFNQQNQPIYLEDRLLNTIHNLTQSAYTFTTNSGTFNNRFVLRYSTDLTSNPFESADQFVHVHGHENQIQIRAIQDQIECVVVYDLLGRMLYNYAGINVAEHSFHLPFSQAVVLVQVKLKSGKVFTQKVAL
jgi:hypothetical protein